jgi:hypothetical protein
MLPDFAVDEAAPADAEALTDEAADAAAPSTGVPADASAAARADPVRWAISAATASV